MTYTIFGNREEAGRLLAGEFTNILLTRPLVLAIPRGGVEVGAPLARALGAELDVVLSRKLRAQDQPELALGAVSESGEIYLNEHAGGLTSAGSAYLQAERSHQIDEIRRRSALFRGARPRAEVAGRSVIVTDDGIATGATMIAALKTVRAERPREIIVAVPIASEDRLAEIRSHCDRVICLDVPDALWAVGQAYRDFGQVSDERVVDLLRASAPATPAEAPRARTSA